MSMAKDAQRLDFLQELNEESEYTGLVILRLSTTGRGWRLHETANIGGVPSVRVAIDNFMAICLGKKEK